MSGEPAVGLTAGSAPAGANTAVTGGGHRRLTLRVPLAAEEIVTGWLWLTGCGGIEESTRDQAAVLLIASFALADGPTAGDWLDLTASHGVTVVSDQHVANEDWLALYRASVVPILVGRGLMVDPREPDAVGEPAVPGDRRLLNLPVRSAFGIGSHESTRLAVELLEDLAAAGSLTGRNLLDLGTGTGILALYGLALGARAAVAFDLDREAAVLASQNARANGLEVAFFAGSIGALGVAARFDVVLVNVLPEEVADELGSIARVVAPGGELVFSGVLASRAPELLDRLADLGLRLVGQRRANEWVGLRLRPG